MSSILFMIVFLFLSDCLFFIILIKAVEDYLLFEEIELLEAAAFEV